MDDCRKYLGIPRYSRKGGRNSSPGYGSRAPAEVQIVFDCWPSWLPFAVLLSFQTVLGVQNPNQSRFPALLEEAIESVANMTWISRNNPIQMLLLNLHPNQASPIRYLAVSSLAQNRPARIDVGDIRVFNPEPIYFLFPVRMLRGRSSTLTL